MSERIAALKSIIYVLKSNLTTFERRLFKRCQIIQGSSVLRMLENYLGANNFKEGIRTYFRKYQYGNARTDDLWAVLSEQTVILSVLSSSP